MRPKTEYQRLLLDPRWQRKRLEILSRDEFQCRHCGAKEKTLHVHHSYYRKGRAPWEYEDSSLVTLCDDCHQVDHEVRPAYESELLEELRGIGVPAAAIGGFAFGLSGLSSKSSGDAKRVFLALVEALSLCEMSEEARAEFLEFAVRLGRHMVPPGAEKE